MDCKGNIDARLYPNVAFRKPLPYMSLTLFLHSLHFVQHIFSGWRNDLAPKYKYNIVERVIVESRCSLDT